MVKRKIVFFSCGLSSHFHTNPGQNLVKISKLATQKLFYKMKRLFLLFTFLLSFAQMRADEGMWLLMLIKRLNGVDMQKKVCILRLKKFILLTIPA
jgi:hypothetical protein